MLNYFGLDDFLHDRMWETIDSYREEREAYWSSDDHEDVTRRAYDELAKMFMEVASSLVAGSEKSGDEEWRSEGKTNWSRLLSRLEEHDAIAVLFDQAIEIRIHELSMKRLNGARERCFQLAKFLLLTRPNQPVEQYLKRLSGCYIAGFLPECVILCRSILENAITEVFARHKIPLPGTDKGISPLKTRLKAAHTLGWLSKGGWDSAEKIRIRGNKAVHEDPHATQDVYGTIVLTSDVLVELYDSK